MDKTYCVYCHTNKVNGKRYIGQTCQNPEYRWNHGDGYRESSRFYSAIQSYGWDNFEHIILKDNLTHDEANHWETYYIDYYHTWIDDPLCNGYNIDKGGNNKGVSQETRIKQSISALNRPIVTDTTKEKLSKIGKGRIRSEDTKDKIALAAYLREEEKRSLNIKRERKVKCLNTGEIFSSCRKAADWCGLVGTSGIASVCRGGKQKTAGVHPETKEKLKWEYVDEVC